MTGDKSPGPTMNEFIDELNQASSAFTPVKGSVVKASEEESKMVDKAVCDLGTNCVLIAASMTMRDRDLTSVEIDSVLMSIIIKVAASAISCVARPKSIKGLANEMAFSFERALILEFEAKAKSDEQ